MREARTLLHTIELSALYIDPTEDEWSIVKSTSLRLSVFYDHKNNMFKFLLVACIFAVASAKPSVGVVAPVAYTAPVAAAYTAPVAAAYTAPVAAAYTAPVAYSAYSAPLAYSAYTYASPYASYLLR